jgi:hypothetical protein
MLDDSAADFDRMFASAKTESDSHNASRPFVQDCLWIVEQAQKSPDTFPGIVGFVLLTIQQPFYSIARPVRDVAENDYAARSLWGWKGLGLHYARAHKRDLHASALAFRDGRIDLDTLILHYLAIPGLGIVKASFLAQMTVGDGACLDTLNLRTLGLAESAFKTPKTLQVKTIRARIAAYNAVWRSVGDSAYWWDAWCDLVASRTHNVRGYVIGTAGPSHDVSRLHRLAITGGIT